MKRKDWMVFLFAAMFALMSASSLVVVGCGGSSGGGGDDDDEPTLPNVGGTTYNSAASVGDLLQVQLNLQSNPPQYSYLGLEGEMKGETDQGTMTQKQGFGTYVYTVDRESTFVVSIPDYLALIAPEGGGLIAGVPQVVSGFTVADIEGEYNYISMTFDGDTPETQIGIFKIAGHNWSVWAGTTAVGNYFAAKISPPPTPDDGGTWEHAGGGIMHVFRDSVKIANAMVLPSTNENVLVIDVCDQGSSGILLGIERQSVSSGSVNGTYDVLDPEYDELYTAEVGGETVAINYPDGTQTKTMNYNEPGDGFIEVGSSGDDYVLVNPDGVYFGGSSDSIFAAIAQ